MSFSRPRDWEGSDDGDEGSRRSSPPAKRPRCCCCCQDTRDFYEREMELLKEQMGCMSQEHKEKLESMSREIGATRDFYERQMELLKKEMRCMSQGHKEGLESIRREMQDFYQKIYPHFGEMSECNQRKQQDRVAVMAEISRAGGYVQQSPGSRISSNQNCITTLRLQFENSRSTDMFSTHEIKADDGTPLKVAIYDSNNMIITYEPFSSMRVHIVAIHGDFDHDHKGQWTEDYLRSKIVPGRLGKVHILSGEQYFRLQNGVGYLNGVKFQDNSSFIPSKKFKLAVMADDQRITERIQEGITESFAVKDVRGCSSQKSRYPSPSDPVHKLKKIAINGRRHKSLENNSIKTVKDFLCSYSKDGKKLRKIFGKISDHDWNIIVEHAHKCNPRKEIYSHCIQERNMSDEQEIILRNSGTSNLRGSCSMQPSLTEQARFHEQVDIRVMQQQISSKYNGLLSGVPPENVASESSFQPNTSDQHVMPHEHLGVIQVTNQQISSIDNEFLPISSMENTVKGSTSLQPDFLECNIVHDGNKLPSSSSVENFIDGSVSLQANPPKHGTMLHGDSFASILKPTSLPQKRWVKIVTTVTAAVIICKKNQLCANASPRIISPWNDPVDWRIQSPWNDPVDWRIQSPWNDLVDWRIQSPWNDLEDLWMDVPPTDFPEY